MSGHSKWHSIRRTKGVLDQKRGQLFTKLARDITIATREGGSGDADANFRLRLAIDKAKASNMPSDNIQRAIDRGLGKGNEAAIEEIVYEGYAPGGIALLIETATDNRNRTNSEVRSTLTKAGGNPGEPGSVAWMFDQKGLITIDLATQKLDTDEVMLIAIDAGAADVEVGADTIDIYTESKQLAAIRQQLTDTGLPISSAELTMQPKTTIQADEKESLQAMRLIERLEDLDDVQKVHSNLDISEELAELFANE
ncbi:MAG: YebC/PmpR family DNA-binding transcriptional regulator [Chloroflexi bacterium AL-W]|nr:YebC/PmpR family DNA-binding transcriptional regulator [Chloroflexi bacterium AL-N1]NOK66265.1 YebC/PmpR family DNA-binding transcriptional regulator [Chloroflexi bacterium AL-N10]NOK73145.1 YebC/PmpR family DNA-binding transcriptional regulator [Chloroflexi bacterium AL-N5]NOK80042.1 YebC/PmpR family DNA-binding transcriptional regulator [Chloroflexi bacterium AL-W]NOK88102.1 YebC/PmpR family DNA-binding transcriptional regulator [Chloroflexi bacterium AL-N15]